MRVPRSIRFRTPRALQLPLAINRLIAKLFARPIPLSDRAMIGRFLTPALALLLLFGASHSSFAQSPGEPADLSQVLEQTQTSSANVPQNVREAIDPPQQSQQKLARVWSNEPALLRLARDKFGAELTETDAKFFAAVAANDWADFRSSPDKTFDPDELTSWADSPVLKADRLTWLCSDPAAAKHVPSHGVWLRGVNIDGKVNLYRTTVPFSLTFYDCLFGNGINIAHAKLQELDIRNCCSAAVEARAVQVVENVYLLTTSIFGGLDFIDANIGGDFDFSGGLAFHGMQTEDIKKQGVALNFHDAKVAGDVKLGDNFRALGQVRLIGINIGRSFTCGGGKFKGGGQVAIDARRATIGSNASFTTGFLADGGLELRRAKIGGDLDCNGGRFITSNSDALSADLIDVAGQVHIGDGFHAEGEVRFINSTIGGDLDCDNGHFIHPNADALSLDGAVIGRSLRIGADPTSPTDDTKELPTGFLTRGTFRLWGTHVNQDILANGAEFDAPEGTAVLACNLKVASRVVLTGVTARGTVNLFSADIEHELDLRGSKFDGQKAYGKIALWANGMQVRGHVYCNQVDGAEPPYRFVSNGLTSFQFATINMHWDLYGAEFSNPDGDALDASDCRVGGYINIDSAKIDGRASFSRAKIDGMWILNKSVEPEKTQLDLRFAHIWVIKDERLADWPPAGQLQLEGLVYDHFDDDSPLDVTDRLAWLRRQYAPPKGETPNNQLAGAQSMHSSGTKSPTRAISSHATAESTAAPQQHANADRYAITPVGYQAATPTEPPPLLNSASSESPITSIAEALPVAEVAAPTAVKTELEEVAGEQKDQAKAQTPPVAVVPDPTGRRYITQPYTQLASVYRAIGQDEQANTVLVARAQRLGELAPAFSAQALWYRYFGRLIGYGYEPFRAIKIGLVIIVMGAVIFSVGARRHLMAETKLAEQVLSSEAQPGLVSPTYPRFNAIVYSLDVFLPFVDLNQVCYWIPGEKPSKPRKARNCLMHLGPYSLKWSTVLHSYLWFQTLAGWTLCTLLAAAVTGIVQS